MDRAVRKGDIFIFFVILNATRMEWNLITYRYECPELSTYDTNFCYLNGKTYRKGETVSKSDSPSCSEDCVCAER